VNIDLIVAARLRAAAIGGLSARKSGGQGRSTHHCYGMCNPCGLMFCFRNRCPLLFSDEGLSQNSFVMFTIETLERTSFSTDQLWMGTVVGCC